MKTNGWGLFRLGLKRRKKEVRRMRLMMCIAVFFLAFTFLFQDNMNGYQMAVNYRAFGRWIVCSESSKFASEPYLQEGGTISRGSKVYCFWPHETEFTMDGLKNLDIWNIGEGGSDTPPETLNTSRSDTSRDSGSFIGTLTHEVAERNEISLIDGRFPENDDEIAMELSVLDALGQGYELGSEIGFYISRFDDSDLLQQLIWEYIDSLGGDSEDLDNDDFYFEDNGIEYDYDVRTIPGRNELYTVKYKLVGTIERYSTRWNTEMSGGLSGNLPGAILTKSEFDRLEMSKRSYRFFDLKHEYETADVWRVAGELMDGIEGAEEYQNVSFALNRNAYENVLWGNAAMYRSITLLLIVISTCIFAYLMANYLGKRRKFFLRMREIGASTEDVWKLSVYECVGSVLPAAALTFVGTYLLSVIAVLAASKVKGVGFFYVFSFKTMLTIIAAIALTIGVSMLAALFIFGGRSVSAKNKNLGRPAVRRLKKRASRMQAWSLGARKKSGPVSEEYSEQNEDTASPAKQIQPKRYLGLLETLKRDRITYRLKNRLLTAISIIICAIILFCAVKTYQPAERYFEIENSNFDVYGETLTGIRCANVKVPIVAYWDGHQKVDNIRAQWTADGLASRTVIPGDAVESILSLPSGVNSIDWRDTDFTHLITFEGKDEDPFFRTYLYTYLVNNQPYREYELDLSHSFAYIFVKAMERDFYGIFCKLNADDYWQRYSKYLDPEVADHEAFMRGEQVIAVVDIEMERPQERRLLQLYDAFFYVSSPGPRSNLLTPEAGHERDGEWFGYRASFEPGDEIAVLCKADQQVKAVVAGVVPLSETDFGYDDMRFLNVLGADAFMQRICEADGTEWGYNSFGADLDAISANERTVNDLINICGRYGVSYENNIVNKAESRTNMVRAIVTYGFFGLMLAVLFFFVTSCIAKDEEVRLSAKYRILNRYGMTERRMRAEKRLDALHRTLPLVLAFPLQMIIRFISNYRYNIDQIKSWANTYKHMSHPALDPIYDTTPFAYAMRIIWTDAGPKLAFIVIGVFALIFWLIISRMDKDWNSVQ